MIYVYALLAGGGPLTTGGEPGLEGNPVELRAHRKVCAAVTRHESKHIEANVDNVWQHERVIEALIAHHVLLPARFSTTFPDEATLERALSLHHDDIVKGFERVSGCVELGVRVLAEADSNQAPQSAAVSGSESPGRAYMLARAAEERRRRHTELRVDELSSALHAPLTEIARESVLRPLLTPNLLLSAAYLVERERVEEFRQRIAALGAAQPSVRVLCTGPWPPYHFVPPLVPAEAEHG